MAADPDGLDLDLAKAVYSEMLAVVEREANRRHRLAKIVGLYYMYNSRLKNHLLYMWVILVKRCFFFIDKQCHMEVLQSELPNQSQIHTSSTNHFILPDLQEKNNTPDDQFII